MTKTFNHLYFKYVCSIVKSMRFFLFYRKINALVILGGRSECEKKTLKSLLFILFVSLKKYFFLGLYHKSNAFYNFL